jgi:hypothetical protein
MFAKTFTDAVTSWRREQRPRAGESWYAVHYRSGWLIEKISFRESVELLRQGLDVRAIDPKDRGRKRRKRSGAAATPGAVDTPGPAAVASAAAVPSEAGPSAEAPAVNPALPARDAAAGGVTDG